MIAKTKLFINKRLDRIAKYLTEHPVFGGLSLILAYFLFDNEFMIGTGANIVKDYVILFSMLAGYFAYYVTYFRNKLKENLNSEEKRKEIGYFAILIFITLFIFFSYDTLMSKYLPSITDLYYKSEVIVFLVLAPVFEELAYRYLLYDKWARVKYGKIVGGLLIGVIFIITHPINGFAGFAMYWIPTLFLFMTYDFGGIKVSIAAHMLFNIVALL